MSILLRTFSEFKFEPGRPPCHRDQDLAYTRIQNHKDQDSSKSDQNTVKIETIHTYDLKEAGAPYPLVPDDIRHLLSEASQKQVSLPRSSRVDDGFYA